MLLRRSLLLGWGLGRFGVFGGRFGCGFRFRGCGGFGHVGVHPLDVGHRSGVAAALAELGDAGVATDAVLGGHGDLFEECLHAVFVTE